MQQPRKVSNDLFGGLVDTTSEICINNINLHIKSVLSYSITSLENSTIAVNQDPHCIIAHLARSNAAVFLNESQIARNELNISRELYNQLINSDESISQPSQLEQSCQRSRFIILQKSKSSSGCLTIGDLSCKCELRILGLLSGFEMMVEGDYIKAADCFSRCLDVSIPKFDVDLWALKLCEGARYLGGVPDTLILLFELNLKFRLPNLEADIIPCDIQEPSSSQSDKETMIHKLDKHITQDISENRNQAVQNSYLSGMYLYALTQSGRMDDLHHALQLTRKIKLFNSIIDPWTDHAMLHAFYNDYPQGHFQSLQMPSERISVWNSTGNFIQHHLWWHIGLSLISLGQPNSALALFHKFVWKINKSGPEEQSGSLSLLLRLFITTQERIAFIRSILSNQDNGLSVLLYQNTNKPFALPSNILQHLTDLQHLGMSIEHGINDVIKSMEEFNTLHLHWSGLFDGTLIACLSLCGFDDKAHNIIKELIGNESIMEQTSMGKRSMENKGISVTRDLDHSILKSLAETRNETARIWKSVAINCLEWGKKIKRTFVNVIRFLPVKDEIRDQSVEKTETIESLLNVAESFVLEELRLVRSVASIEQADVFVELAWSALMNSILLIREMCPNDLSKSIDSKNQLRMISVALRLRRIRNRYNNGGINNDVPHQIRQIVIDGFINPFNNCNEAIESLFKGIQNNWNSLECDDISILQKNHILDQLPIKL